MKFFKQRDWGLKFSTLNAWLSSKSVCVKWFWIESYINYLSKGGKYNKYYLLYCFISYIFSIQYQTSYCQYEDEYTVYFGITFLGFVVTKELTKLDERPAGY